MTFSGPKNSIVQTRPRRQAAVIGAARMFKTCEEIRRGTEDEEEDDDNEENSRGITEETIVCRSASETNNNSPAPAATELGASKSDGPLEVAQKYIDDGDDDDDGDFELDKESNDGEYADEDEEVGEEDVSEIEEMEKQGKRHGKGTSPRKPKNSKRENRISDRLGGLVNQSDKRTEKHKGVGRSRFHSMGLILMLIR